MAWNDSERKQIIDYVVQQLDDLFEPDDARRWINAPHDLLGGVSPVQLIDAGNLDAVMRLIDQLKEGVYL